MRTIPWVRLASVARRPDVSQTSDPAVGTSASASAPMSVRRPQPRLDPPTRVLHRRKVRRTGRFVLGVHGGAGESLLAELLGWKAANHAWPMPTTSGMDRNTARATWDSANNVVVLTCRSDHGGLEAARDASREWAASTVPGIELIGLVVIADAPGRLPRPLRDLAAVVAGGLPHCWHLPWLSQLRFGAQPDPRDPAVRRLVDGINLAAAERTTTSADGEPNRTDHGAPTPTTPVTPALEGTTAS